jgi:hypothetical protein
MTTQPPSSPLYIATAFDLRFDETIPCVEMTWRGYHTSPAFRQQNIQVMDLIAAHRATKLLGDVREFILIGAEDQTWLNEYWLPDVMSCGLQQVALVAPVFYFNKVAVEAVVDCMTSAALQVCYFDHPDRARAWLKCTAV